MEPSSIKYNGLPDDNSKNGLELVRNILGSISTLILSSYSGYYSIKLLHLIKDSNFKKSIRTKIIVQAISIQIVLILRLLDIWMAGVLWKLEEQWIWPTFMLFYELLSEISPFIIFCWMLFKQVFQFNRIVKRNQGLAMIDKYGMQDAMISTEIANSNASVS